MSGSLNALVKVGGVESAVAVLTCRHMRQGAELEMYCAFSCEWFGRWKAGAEGGGVEGAVAELKLTNKGEEIEKQLPGGKKKLKARPEVVLETSTRSKKKCVTTILGAPPATQPTLLHDAHARVKGTTGGKVKKTPRSRSYWRPSHSARRCE